MIQESDLEYQEPEKQFVLITKASGSFTFCFSDLDERGLRRPPLRDVDKRMITWKYRVKYISAFLPNTVYAIRQLENDPDMDRSEKLLETSEETVKGLSIDMKRLNNINQNHSYSYLEQIRGRMFWSLVISITIIISMTLIQCMA
eukprot:TRINITY_DN2642_c0_g1_i1.p1 TRINITY_DN2642_c0_g1~~TRINITY_DN2642_c0_g1_i1.p1  ORF type:complete len:145 (-),score=9.15 TRINITY_DN2642_c0_g1_i1:20-454(-)